MPPQSPSQRMISISILIPCLRERVFIEQCLESVLAFEIPAGAELLEVLVMDGGSTDGTRELVQRKGEIDSRIRLLDNPGRIQSTGLNIGLSVAAGKYIVRLDAHSVYPQDYLALLIETSLRTGCDNVGGLFITQPRGDGYRSSVIRALTT